MSHDIRTPMNAVLGFTTLLATDAENPDKVREYTKKIMASGQHLLSLINDILDVSKIESGKVVLNYERFSLKDVISSVEAIIQPMAKARGQEFSMEVTGIRHEYLVGDETRLNQILLNLLSNAVKYTPEGGHIWFRLMDLKQRSSQYAYIRIEVEDNGYGMTSEYLETIFDTFTRAENSTTNKIQGTGLGMAITKSIVELMGGTIEVFSKVNQGSLFRVDLELCILEEQTDPQFWKKRGINHIMAVGVDSETQEKIRILMESSDVQLDIAVDTKEAMGRIRDKGGDWQLVLLDCDASDLQDARELKEALPSTAAMVFLAKFGIEGMEDVLWLDRTGVLTKPFFVSASQEKIAEMWTEPDDGEDGSESEDSGDLKGMHFLAAEDNEINAEILAELLEIEGASCEIVENGRLAVDRFRQAEPGEFDAILMDVQMPVMNGHDATRVIRSLDRDDAGRIPIIAMTANAFAEDEKAALDAGMDAHVAKPLDMEILKNVIKQYSRRKEAL